MEKNNILIKEKEEKIFLEAKTGKGVYLNLFSGANILPGFKNIDSHFQANNVYNFDIQKLPFYEDTIDIIYASLVNDTASSLFLTNSFKEWHRVLKKDGRLYLKLPNLKQIIFKLLSPSTSEKKRKLLLFILYGQEITRFPENSLGYLLNPTSLSQRGFYSEDLNDILKIYGFTDIKIIPYEEFGNPFIWVEANGS